MKVSKPRRSFSLWRWAGAVLPPLALICLFEVLHHNQALMSAWVFGVMAPLEQLLGRLTAPVPFSVGEAALLLFLVFCLIWIVRALVLLVRDHGFFLFLRRLCALVATFLWIWAGVCWLWNAAYYVPTFAQRSGLETEGYSVETLAAVTELFAQNAARLSGQMTRDEEGHFVEDIDECFDRGVEIYENLTREFPCLDMESVEAKPLLCSKLQSLLGFTGIYSPITGEANVNVDAPRCLLPATIAHEMSHQRMVALEDEANFLGIAACVTSEDPVFQYSGYLMGLIHLCNALYPVAPDLWYEIAGKYFTAELSTDWNVNNAYWAQRSSQVEETASELYDTFLKGNDQQLGIRSYGACVDLLVAYFS